MSDTGPEAEILEPLSDETLLVFLSDTHIGGTAGTDIFESAAELTALLEELGRHEGPVVLVLAGDLLDLLRMEDPDSGDDRIASTLARPQYRELFATLRGFAKASGHRVIYVVGNHDAEVWWNPEIRRSLEEAGLVHEFRLSLAARFASAPEQLIYCEHGNQLDPANRITDYTNPLDTPVGEHVVTELVRPLGSGANVTESIDLREVSYVFPLDAIPEWIGGRMFYQFLSQAIRWLLTPLLVALAVVAALASRTDEGTLALRRFLAGVAFDLGLLVVAFGLLFFVSRRVTRQAISTMETTSFGRTVASKRYRPDDEIRDLFETGRPPPLGANIASAEIAVWVSGHTHAPAISEVARDDGSTTMIANTGCWLRQLQPVSARLGAPTVFVPAFVHTHVRVRPSQGSLTVELWNHPRSVDRRVRWVDPLRIVPKRPRQGDGRLQWIERVAIVGRLPSQPTAQAGPRLISQRVVPRRSHPIGGSPDDAPSGERFP